MEVPPEGLAVTLDADAELSVRSSHGYDSARSSLVGQETEDQGERNRKERT